MTSEVPRPASEADETEASFERVSRPRRAAPADAVRPTRAEINLANLRRYLSKYFGDQEVICFKEESCFINPALKVWRDTDIFLQYFNAAKTAEREGQTEKSARLYSEMTQFGSEFTEDLRHENWTTWPRDEFSEKYIRAHRFLADRYFDTGRYDQARELLRRILLKDECLESIHQKLMQCYIEEGQGGTTQRPD